jgi:hypothetical protein
LSTETNRVGWPRLTYLPPRAWSAHFPAGSLTTPQRGKDRNRAKKRAPEPRITGCLARDKQLFGLLEPQACGTRPVVELDP